MAEEKSLTWTRLINGIGSLLIAYLVVFLLFALVIPLWLVPLGIGPFGAAGTVVSIFVGALLAYGLYVFFERV